MNIDAIFNALAAVLPVGQAGAAEPSAAEQGEFAALMKQSASPDELLAAQHDFNQSSMGAALISKEAGMLTGAVNKLVNLQ